VRVRGFYTLSTIPHLLHTHLHVNISVSGRTSEGRLGPFNSLSEIKVGLIADIKRVFLTCEKCLQSGTD
jgi:hypothetical protein